MRSFVWAAAASLAAPAWAEAPKVVTDIAPVHSLVATVMQGVGEPTMLIDPGASPHGYALRPSQARALSNADVVFWIGEGLTPWLEQPLESLAADAESVELLELEASIKLEFREGATFEGHDHDEPHGHEEDEHEDHAEHDEHEGHDHEEHEEHGRDEHDDHDEHGHDDHEKHAEHDDHDDEHDHAHEGVDPHGWLDPANAKVWLQVIADELSHLDPENAQTYAKNAEKGAADLDQLIADLSAELEPAHGLHFVVFHDAYHYFENRFGLAATGAISLGDASDPSVARVAAVREAVADAGVTCAFAEPQFNPGLIGAVAETGVKVAVIDPLGVGLELGPDLYGQTLRNLSANILSCLD